MSHNAAQDLHDQIKDHEDQIKDHEKQIEKYDSDNPDHIPILNRLYGAIEYLKELIRFKKRKMKELSESYDLFESKEEIKRLKKENAKLISQHERETDPEKKNKIHKKIQDNIKKRKELESGKKARPKKTATLAESIMRIHRDVLLEKKIMTILEAEKETTIQQRQSILQNLMSRLANAKSDEERKFHEEDIDGMIKSIRKSQRDAKK